MAALEMQTEAFKNLAQSAEEQDLGETLEKVIKEVKELSDSDHSNDAIQMSDFLSANFDNLLKGQINQEQVNIIIKEIDKLERKYTYAADLLKQMDNLKALLLSAVAGETPSQYFETFASLVASWNISQLREKLNPSKQRELEIFVRSPENKNKVLDTYLKILWITDMSNGTTWRDRGIIKDVKDRVESTYSTETRWEWELDTKVFTGIQFFTDYISKNSEWDWSDIQSIPQTECDWHMYSVDQYVAKFNNQNESRKATNTEKMNGITITDWVDLTKVKRKTWENGEETVVIVDNDGKVVWDPVTVDDFMTRLNITQPSAPEWTAFAKGELDQKINELKPTRFNQVKTAVDARTEPEAPITPFEVGDITIKLNYWITAEQIHDAIINLPEATKTENKDKINAVIEALKNPWETLPNRWNSSVKGLQETMQQELTLTPRLRPDWKFWRLTFYAMQKYIWVETGKLGDLKYECGHMLGSELSWMLEHFEDQDYLSRALGDTTSDLQWLQDKAERWIRDPLQYVKSKLEQPDTTFNVPWKAILKDILNGNCKNKIKLLQFALLPKYTWNIDGIMWPSTKKALQSYIENGRWSDKDGENIKALWTTNDSNIISNIEGYDSTYWESITDEASVSDMYKDSYALIGNTIKFFDNTTIRKLKTGTEKINGTPTNDCLTWIINGKKYIYWGWLYNSDWTEASADDKTKYEARFEAVDTSKI